MQLFSVSSKSRVGVCCVLAALIAGCGGGGGDGGGTPTSQSTTNPVPAPSTPSTPSPPAPTNAAPTIEGQPTATVLAGQRYSFEPVAADENGDALTYSAANLPAWASLDPKTGRITGTPTAADVATYNGIVLSVSDGQSSASLAAFSINVTTVATGAATLSWNPPTQNVDGSALINLTGYRILYGQTSGALDREVKLDNPALSSYMVENLSAGTWYFAVVAVNADGIRSNASNVASKTIS